MATLLHAASGLWCEVQAHGAVRRMGRADDVLNLFVGNAVEGAPANLWLRVHGDGGVKLLPLLGPAGGAHIRMGNHGFVAQGASNGLRWRLRLVLAAGAPAWFWHLDVHNTAAAAQTLDAVLVQDVALTAYGNVRLNEHYVSHYVDLSPLRHAGHGWVVAARQNLAIDAATGGRNPWALMGSLRQAVSFATDGRQLRGLASVQGLPGTRLQHEHALIGLQDAPCTLGAGAQAAFGFFGRMEADHPAATGAADLLQVAATLALPEAAALPWPAPSAAAPTTDAAAPTSPATTLFSTAPLLRAQELDAAELHALFGPQRRHAEQDGAGALLAFFTTTPDGAPAHVVLPAKEHAVLRPHGHMLRGGAGLVPDECALTSTVWMAGVFHSMVTQGHVGTNRFLSTVHGYLGQFRSHGQRVFVHLQGRWQQLGVPSAFVMEAGACRWVYKHAGGLFDVRSSVPQAPSELALDVSVIEGGPLRLLVTHHVALGGDDGSDAAPACWQPEGDGVFVTPPPGSTLAARFAHGGFTLAPAAGSRFASVGGDAPLWSDGLPHGEPFVCIEAGAAPAFGLRIRGRLVDAASVDADADADADADTDATAAAAATPLPTLQMQLQPPAGSALALAPAVARLAEIVPWFTHNALVHYLAPRGLEQSSGGGWGTRDVSQGPLEMLLAFDRPAPVRDLLLRTFAAQNADGDWPQWFMFFERDRAVRAGDSHGDIVFWPLLGLARYLLASGDAALLDAPVRFHDDAPATVWQHVQRALVLIGRRCIPGTTLAAYGHGDWNDALQPADPALRDRLCSAWTVTLHHQMLQTLAAGLRAVGRAADAGPLEQQAAAVAADFRRLLVAGGVVAGYALFAEDGAAPELLLHPSDTRTGLRYSLLPMVHAVIADMLPPAQARAQLRHVAQHLTGPDGARLFDAPMAYRGGPQTIFQRAESSAHFGREIGVMYMHAHLRYAQALAHVGDAAGFFDALCRANPIGLQTLVPSAALRQSNCYHSSSDAAFPDRDSASRDYAQVAAGTVALEGGWRIYSSGPGIALGLLVQCFVGIGCERDDVLLDPVLPPALSGLQVALHLFGAPLSVSYRCGPAGCGVVAVVLNGQPLAFTRRANPHRAGAAVVPRAAFDGLLPGGGRRLHIEIG